ncbi:unnamed protein product [Miscanthus lutarioriparius]|uniref:Acid phosphatase/vanadium-dependent haloperoxidase-related protein n=1 Tax=Miscanthus lutarioriparius TaxID=422564 RepID=A0A811RUZ7_9POAL|nr:unnamed protein product [Miscanthus lutarioriparius]
MGFDCFCLESPTVLFPHAKLQTESPRYVFNRLESLLSLCEYDTGARLTPDRHVAREWLKEKRWDARKFLTSAGVMSSLSATVGSLAVAVGQQEGADSSAFALALVFAAVVMYDASGIRWHTGRQAALLNQIVCDFPPEHPIISTFRPLREPLGHSPLQVFAGALVGCAVAYFFGKSV